MFRAELSCEACGFSTDSFIVGYYPPNDSVDVVLRNMNDGTFRIVRFEDISRQAGQRPPREDEVDAVVDRCVSRTVNCNEERLDVWVALRDFEKRRCPQCGEQEVTLRLLSIT